MEYVQERVTTLHDLADHVPDAPLGETAVVVPMTARERGRPAAERTLETLASVDPARVVVPVRASGEEIGRFRDWIAASSLGADVLWCNAPAVTEQLAEVVDGVDAGGVEDAGSVGDDGDVGDGAGGGDVGGTGDGDEVTTPAFGKGADVWLGLGVAAEHAEYVVVHDADATSYDETHVPRLAAPLADDVAFTKGYYARVEDDGLYGRLFRLFYEPLLAALAETHEDDVVGYLGAFRYALAGEVGLTAEFARSVRAQRAWGLEVGMLGEAYRHAGTDGVAQVDLGVHDHDHRSVEGDGGLASMSEQVGDALGRVLADHDVEPEFEALAERYRQVGDRFVEQYAADARHNGLPFNREREREQVAAYAEAVGPPGPDTRLPAWRETSLDGGTVLEASRRALASAASNPR